MVRSYQAPKLQPGGFSETYCYPPYSPNALRMRSFEFSHRLGRLIVGILAAIWFVITLPFRLIVGIIELLGRLTGIALGFALMVVGVALWAGPFFIIGIPLFIIGLLLTLRCLG